MLLRKDDPWNRKLDLPDVRNWRVVDRDGRSLGFVESVVIDTQNDTLEAILTGANDRFSADQIEIGEHVVRVQASPEIRQGKEERSEQSFDTYDEAFRDHFKGQFSSGERSFEDLSEAYTFGRQMAADAHFSGRSYERAREDLQAYWINEGRVLPYDLVESAIWFAYELVRDSMSLGVGGLEREARQILGGASRPSGESEDAGSYMAMGSPVGGSDSSSAGAPEQGRGSRHRD